jgi:hypothetical protein
MAKSNKPVILKPLLVSAAVLIIGVSAGSSTVLGQSDLLNKPVDSQKTSSLSDRITERKKKYKLELSASAQDSIEKKCAAAQVKITELKEKDAVSIDKYYKAYGSIADQVSTMVARLNGQGVSTAGIQTALNQYVDAANQYLVDADLYKAALADMEAMECQEDAEGFAVSLQDARKLRTKLATDAQAAETKVQSMTVALINAKDKL